MIEYPISEITTLGECSNPKQLILALQMICSARLSFICSERETAFKYIIKITPPRNPSILNSNLSFGQATLPLGKHGSYAVEPEEIIGFACKAACHQAALGFQALLELWCDGDSQSRNAKDLFLAERWELEIAANPIPLITLSLVRVVHTTLSDQGSWSRRHLEFCRFGLAEEWFQCVWNGFRDAAALGRRTDKTARNEFWGTEFFLKQAIPAGTLLTDNRSRKDKGIFPKHREANSNFTSVISHTKSGAAIIRLIDAPEALTEFEDSILPDEQK